MIDDVFVFAAGILVTALAATFIGDNVTSKDIENATAVCDKNEGIRVIKNYVFTNNAICNNGAKFEITASWAEGGDK